VEQGAVNGELWTKAREKQLRELHALKLTPRQIAGVMGGTDRNAVIGKLHRMGLKVPASVRLKPQNIARRAPLQFTSPALPTLPPMPDGSNIPHAQRCTLLQLKPGVCKWPLGEPQSPDFFFCGGDAVEGKPYCAGHCRVAYKARAA
jgi:GcrA cell cycle regulator